MKARIAAFVLFCIAAFAFTSGAQAQVFPPPDPQLFGLEITKLND